MNDQSFDILLLTIPVIGVVITSILIPYIKTKISVTQMDEIVKWVTKAVQAAEVLFDTPKSGKEKREYVINFILKGRLSLKIKFVFFWKLHGHR